MLIDLLLLLLPVAAGSGWYAAKRSNEAHTQKAGEQFTRPYLTGLNYLLNEQPDKAVDIFIKMLETDSEVVETHLALGVLFRRRGETGRAIRIHQNVIARSNLSRELRMQALLALGEDYLKAGMLDRAERVLLEFTDMATGEIAAIGLRHLLEIYQQEKNWDAAITIAQRLVTYDALYQKNIAHYHCELARQAQEQQQLETAQRQLKRAIDADARCIRAYLMQGQLEMAQGKYKNALQAYQRVVQEDPDYLAEIIHAVTQSYVALSDEEGLLHYLQKCLQAHPRTSLALAVTERLQQRDDQSAIAFLTRHLQQRPSVRGLQQLIKLQLAHASNARQADLTLLHDLTTSLLLNKPAYRCVHCGFNSKVLHWLCPGCHYWGSIKPIQGPEGE